MSVRSMTGFGRGHAHAAGLRVDVEISSVNRKQLDILVTMPRPLQSLESRVVELVSPRLSRGRIQVVVTVQAGAGRQADAVRVNTALAAACVDELRRVARQLKLSPEISISELVRIPGIIEVRDAGHEPERVRPLLDAALTKALDALESMRKREGKAMAADLTGRLKRLESIVGGIARRAPTLVAAYRASLRQRVQSLAAESGITDERLEKEVVLYADRCDVTEELTRLGSHAGQVRGMLKSGEPAGRSLDFLAQEMFREINTIGSKAGDPVVSPLVVQFKAELERFREQVQNIE